MEYTHHALTQRSARQHTAAAIGSVFLLGAMNAALNASYAASNHPVRYAEGQTTFDGEQIKEFYAVMSEAGTLSTYVWTQVLDFGFIAAMAVVGITVGALLARGNRTGSWGHRAGRAVTTAMLAGATFDVLENLVSFIMLAQPETFANWLAVPYSTFAVLKFALITIAMLATVFSTMSWIAQRLVSRRFTSSMRLVPQDC